MNLDKCGEQVDVRSISDIECAVSPPNRFETLLDSFPMHWQPWALGLFAGSGAGDGESANCFPWLSTPFWVSMT